MASIRYLQNIYVAVPLERLSYSLFQQYLNIQHENDEE